MDAGNECGHDMVGLGGNGSKLPSHASRAGLPASGHHRRPALGSAGNLLQPGELCAMSTTSLAPRENVAAGIGWMLLTTFLFLSMDSLAKYLMQSYAAPQVVWARFFFHLLLALAILGPGLLRGVRSARPLLQAARSVLILLTTSMFFVGLTTVPLATATTIMFLTPLLVTVLSVPLLGEKVGVRRLTGVVIGLAGALVIVRPGFGDLSLGMLLVLGASLSNSFYQLVTRQVRHYDEPNTTLLYTALAGTIVFSTLAPLDWRPPQGLDWALFVLLGILGALSQLCLIRAFRLAPAAVVSPFSYTGLIWATIFGFVFFLDLPDVWTIAGAALIVGSGLYVFHRERTLAVAVSRASKR
jgi:drug/metabolite transporter (DMT)-like permease